MRTLIDGTIYRSVSEKYWHPYGVPPKFIIAFAYKIRRHCNTIVQYYLSIHNKYTKQYVTACVSYTLNHKPYVDYFPLNTTNFLVVFHICCQRLFISPLFLHWLIVFALKPPQFLTKECKRKYTKLVPPYCAKWLKFMLHTNSLIIGEIVWDSISQNF